MQFDRMQYKKQIQYILQEHSKGLFSLSKE